MTSESKDEIDIDRVRSVVDQLVEQWPSESRPDTATDHPALLEVLADLNALIEAGCGYTISRLLVENVAYRVLVDQEVSELPAKCHLQVAFACSTTDHYASQALSWVASCALGRHDYLFASMMTSFQGDHLVQTIAALCDLGSALRDGKAIVTLVPIEDGEEVADLPTTVVVGE